MVIIHNDENIRCAGNKLQTLPILLHDFKEKKSNYKIIKMYSYLIIFNEMTLPKSTEKVKTYIYRI